MIFRANSVHTMETLMDPCGEFWALVQWEWPRRARQRLWWEIWRLTDAKCSIDEGKFYLWMESKLLLVFKSLTHCLMSLRAGNFHLFPVVNVVWCCAVSLSIFPTFSVFSCIGSKLMCCRSNAGRSFRKSASPWTLFSNSFSFQAEIKN